MRKRALLSVFLTVAASAAICQGGVINLGTWTGDQAYQMVMSAGGSPVSSSRGCDLFDNHALLNKYTDMSEVHYQFQADSAIIDSVKVDLDYYDWTPENSSGNNFFINVNGTVAQYLSLPNVYQNGGLGYATVTFAEPVDTVDIRIQRYLRWGGDDQGFVNVYEGTLGSATPWVFHAVPEPMTIGMLMMGSLLLRRRK